VYATLPDLLRLLFVPALAWAAYHDIRVRRVPDELWLPFVGLAVVLLAWDYAVASRTALFLVRVAVSLLVCVLAYGFWFIGGFGGADVKAFCVVALLFPTYPTYDLLDTAFPLIRTRLGVFSVTVVTNAMLASLAYPVALGVRNALAGRFTKRMFVGLSVPVRELDRRHGSLLETRDGFSRGGLDVDALRMYLRWRGLTLDRLLDAPERYRDPETVVGTFDPTDGTVGLDTPRVEQTVPGGDADTDGGDAQNDAADDWAAERFLDDIDSSAYGTSVEGLREGLETIASRERVWITPGIPFIVPLLVGLLLALTAGDLLFALLRAVGLY